MTDDEIDVLTVMAMGRAGSRPEFVHAYRRCRVLLTEERRSVSTEEERAAWRAAIHESRQFQAWRD